MLNPFEAKCFVIDNPTLFDAPVISAVLVTLSLNPFFEVYLSHL